MATKTNGRLSWGEKISYGFGDCAANVYVALSGTFYTGFLTDTVGIAAAAAGTMMLLARIFDGATDLMMGAVVDKTKSKYGKARPWLLWTAPFMMIGLILMFMNPAKSDGGKLAYTYFSYIFMNCIVYTANNLPFNALLSRMTLDVQDRAETASARFIMTQITTLIVNVFATNAIATIGTDGAFWTWTKLTVVLGLVEVVMLLICFFGCKEHVGENSTGEVVIKEVPFKEALPALMKNKYFFLQALLFMLIYINVVGVGSLTYYFCAGVMGNLALLTNTSICNALPAIVANFFNPVLVKKFGKRKVMIGASVVSIIGACIVGLGGTSLNLTLVYAGLILKALANGPLMTGLFAMTADVVDYGEWKTGVRSEGLVNSCTSFGMKVGIGLGSFVSTLFLTFGGYVGTAEVQTQKALDSITFGFGYFSAVMAVITLIIVLLMNIDKHLPEIEKTLKAKDRT